VVTVAFDVAAPLDNGGVPVQFFDGTIVAPAGPARLALRTGAAAGCVRQPDDMFHVWFTSPIEIQSTGDEERDVQALTQAIARECEDFIRHHPDQWYMFRRMWVDTPASEQG
jgi:KDO2-lipid IV(A) lauroyltransferase